MFVCFSLMIRLPSRSTRKYTRFPYTPLIRSEAAVIAPVRGSDCHIGYSRRIELADGQALATNFFRQERQCRLHPVLDVDDCLVGLEADSKTRDQLHIAVRCSGGNRKSVVQGNGVAVRGNLAGRRILKNKHTRDRVLPCDWM